VCQSRGMAYVFPRAQSNVLFMFSVTYLRIVMVIVGLVCKVHSKKPQEALNLLVTEER
jgi:hypothetical protein